VEKRNRVKGGFGAFHKVCQASEGGIYESVTICDERDNGGGVTHIIYFLCYIL